VRPLDSAAARLERLGLLAGGTPAPAWDRTGHVRRQGIGVDDDLSIGASIAALVLEA
jgi:hypothetical protein